MSDASALPGPDSVEAFVMPNGIRANLLANFSSPAVVIDGLVFGGSIQDPPDRPGLASFTADMLDRGTADHDFAALSDTLESIGAEINFGAGRHSIGFSAKCLSEDLDTVVSLLTDMLGRPSFDPVQVERVKGQIVTGLRQKSDSTRYRSGQRFRELAYGVDHPYGRSPDGTADSVAAVTREDLAKFHRDNTHPRDGIVTVVGAFDAASLRERLTATLGAWQPDSDPPERPSIAEPSGLEAAQREDVVMPGKFQADLVMGHPSIPRQHRDWMAASMANAVLGVFGMMGRLGENVRDRRGLAYYAYSRLVGGLGPGPWYAAAGVNPAGVDEAIDAMIEEIHRLRDHAVPAAELDDVKAYLTGSLPLQLETNEGIAQALGDMVLYDLGLDYLHRYAGLVSAVTPEAVQAAARAHVHPDRLAIVVAGPGEPPPAP